MNANFKDVKSPGDPLEIAQNAQDFGEQYARYTGFEPSKFVPTQWGQLLAHAKYCEDQFKKLIPAIKREVPLGFRGMRIVAELSHRPDGEYEALITGNTAVALDNTFQVKTGDLYVKGVNIPCCIVVKDGTYEVVMQ